MFVSPLKREWKGWTRRERHEAFSHLLCPESAEGRGPQKGGVSIMKLPDCILTAGKAAEKSWYLCGRGPYQGYEGEEKRTTKVCKTGSYTNSYTRQVTNSHKNQSLRFENLAGEEESPWKAVPPSVRPAARGRWSSFRFQWGTWSSRPVARWVKVSRKRR